MSLLSFFGIYIGKEKALKERIEKENLARAIRNAEQETERKRIALLPPKEKVLALKDIVERERQEKEARLEKVRLQDIARLQPLVELLEVWISERNVKYGPIPDMSVSDKGILLHRRHVKWEITRIIDNGEWRMKAWSLNDASMTRGYHVDSAYEKTVEGMFQEILKSLWFEYEVPNSFQ